MSRLCFFKTGFTPRQWQFTPEPHREIYSQASIMASKAFYAVVAGVGAGTGRSAALRFAKAYPVVLLARKPENYSGIVDEINKAGGKAIGISTDVSSADSVASAFADAQKEFPGSKLAAAIFNVGSGFSVKPFLESNVEELNVSLAAQA